VPRHEPRHADADPDQDQATTDQQGQIEAREGQAAGAARATVARATAGRVGDDLAALRPLPPVELLAKLSPGGCADARADPAQQVRLDLV
jgi:hypothetical protein